MSKAVLITVNTNQKLIPWRIALTVFSQVGVIGIGVLTGSAAMQWAGFLLCALLLFVVVASMSKKTTGISIKEARAYLDELEEVEVQP